MPLNLPDLARTDQQLLRLCGSVDTTDRALIKLLAQKRENSFSYRKANAIHYFRMLTGGNKQRHFHLEIATKDFFEPGKLEVTNKRRSIEGVVSQIYGESITLHVAGIFVVPFSQLSEGGVIRLISLDTQTGNVRMRLTGGNIELTGSPVSRITWQVRGQDQASIYLYARRTDVVDEEYLTRNQQWLRRMYELFILGAQRPESRDT